MRQGTRCPRDAKYRSGTVRARSASSDCRGQIPACRNASADSRPSRRAPCSLPDCAASTICGVVMPGFDGITPPHSFSNASRRLRVVDIRVARQPVGQHAHVRRAARIRVVAERHVAHFALAASNRMSPAPRSPRRKLPRQTRSRLRAPLRAPPSAAPISRPSAGSSCPCSLPIQRIAAASWPSRHLDELRRLALQLDVARIQ